MAATAMDPVDIANILAQELLYQQVTFHIADSVLSIFFFLFMSFYFPCCMARNYSSRVFFSFLFYCQKTKMIIIILRRGKIIAITVILTITYYVYIRVIYPSRLSVYSVFLFTTKLKWQCH